MSEVEKYIVDFGADPIVMEMILEVLKTGGIFTAEELWEDLRLRERAPNEIRDAILALAKLGKVKLWVGIP